jgi:hypothetical protein
VEESAADQHGDEQAAENERDGVSLRMTANERKQTSDASSQSLQPPESGSVCHSGEIS